LGSNPALSFRLTNFSRLFLPGHETSEQDVRTESHYALAQLFGENAFFDTLGDVMSAYRKQAVAEAT
jgi:hypothetical protein